MTFQELIQKIEGFNPYNPNNVFEAQKWVNENFQSIEPGKEIEAVASGVKYIAKRSDEIYKKSFAPDAETYVRIEIEIGKFGSWKTFTPNGAAVASEDEIRKPWEGRYDD